MIYETGLVYKVEELDPFIDEYVYDISMSNGTTHMFFANDILVHNSTHLTLKPLLDSLNEPLLLEDKSINPIVYEKATELQEAINKGMDEWSKKVLNSKDPRFFFKREAICPVGIYQSKKHYILHVKDKGESDPIPCDYIKPVGVELVKSTMSSAVKDIIRSVIEAIVYTKNREDTTRVYREGYEKFKSLSPEDIAFRGSMNTYDNYASKSTGFQTAKRTPPAVKGAIYHNNILTELGLDTKYDLIKSGQKVRWFYTEPNNVYGVKCITFTSEYPPELLEIVKPDYELMFDKIVAKAVDRFYQCVQWRLVNFQMDYACDLLDLFGVKD